MTLWRHLVWDMGGTMIDTYPAVDKTLVDVCRSHGCEISQEEVTRLTRVSIAAAGVELASRCGIAVEEFVAAYARLKQDWRTGPPPVMAGARDLLAQVTRRGGLNLVVTHRDRESAEELLRAHGIEVADLLCAPDGYPRKPDPAMHRLVVERNGLDPAECLAVGDRGIDTVAAMRAGLDWALLVTLGLPVPPVPEGGRVIQRLTELMDQAEIRE